ncbi:MAG: hypothetical protein JKY65_12350 [Planctomycetes bacterium]|nr:hypothetical protein [Planctomycetota bacterium]
MKLWIPLAITLALPLIAEAQASKPAHEVGDQAETKQILEESRTQLQAGDFYASWDLARTVLLAQAKHPLALRLERAARILAPEIDAHVVEVKGKQVRISVGADDLVKASTVMTVMSKKKPIALIRVVEVSRDSSLCEVLESKGAIQAGCRATSASSKWPWFHGGKQKVLPQTGKPHRLRAARFLALTRKFYGLFGLSNTEAEDPCLKLFADAARLAQRPVQGKIVKLDGAAITVGMGSQDGVNAHDQVFFLRDGKVLGSAQARSVKNTSTLCVLAGPKLKVGDVATTDSKYWRKVRRGN